MAVYSLIFSYYPGCTLTTTAKKLNECAHIAAKILGFTLDELDEWQCCGAVYPLGTDEVVSKLAAVRALKNAKSKGQALITLCSACHHVLKRVNNDIRTNNELRSVIKQYDADLDYTGDTEIIHYMEVLKNHVGFDELKKKVINPLTGRKIGAYYGCMMLRPSSVLMFDDPENPKIFESFIKSVGATPVIYPYRNECCGGYISLKEKVKAYPCNVLIGIIGILNMHIPQKRHK